MVERLEQTLNPNCMSNQSGNWKYELIPTGSNARRMARTAAPEQPASIYPILADFHPSDYIFIGALCALLTIPLIRLTCDKGSYQQQAPSTESTRQWFLESRYARFNA